MSKEIVIILIGGVITSLCTAISTSFLTSYVTSIKNNNNIQWIKSQLITIEKRLCSIFGIHKNHENKLHELDNRITKVETENRVKKNGYNKL